MERDAAQRNLARRESGQRPLTFNPEHSDRLRRALTRVGERRDVERWTYRDQWSSDWADADGDLDTVRNDPITYEPLVDPVVASDGRTYNVATLRQLFDGGQGRSPFTRQALEPWSFRHLDARRVLGLPEVEDAVVYIGRPPPAHVARSALLVAARRHHQLGESRLQGPLYEAMRRRAVERGQGSRPVGSSLSGARFEAMRRAALRRSSRDR